MPVNVQLSDYRRKIIFYNFSFLKTSIGERLYQSAMIRSSPNLLENREESTFIIYIV